MKNIVVIAFVLMLGCAGASNQSPSKSSAALYREEYIVEIDECRAKYSSAYSEHYDAMISVPGQQPLGKKYKVTVEEMP